jgi:hypothetical protein
MLELLCHEEGESTAEQPGKNSSILVFLHIRILEN